MPAWKITPRTKSCCNEQAGACKHQKRFLSPLRTTSSRRHQEVQRVATSPSGRLFPLCSTERCARMQLHGQALEQISSQPAR